MSSRVSSSQTALGPVAPNIPWNLSCLVLYEPLRPNYNKQPIRVGTDGGNKFWAPPNLKNAYHRDKGSAQLFRWKGGSMTNITAGNLNKQYSTYAVATIFTQWPDTPHLLAVTFDAEKKDVAEENGGWKVLSFDYIPRHGTQGIYSSVSVAGDQQQLAAPGSPAWVPQLLPKVYDYDPTPNRPSPISAGLIGNLALLFALPAFSALPSALSHILTRYMQPNRWHRHQLQHGHEKERGMVVTVFLDPNDKKGSNEPLLDRLQSGGYGPFYGPSGLH